MYNKIPTQINYSTIIIFIIDYSNNNCNSVGRDGGYKVVMT